MNSSWKNIAMTVLNASNEEDITVERISEKIKEYPYFSALPFIKTLLLKKQNAKNAEHAASLASLYFQNPVWFSIQLKQAELETAVSAKPVHNGTTKVETEPTVEELTFEPLHTVDYFASQGIKAPVAVASNDPLAVKLKSFTEWLKTMKKVNAEDVKPTINQTEEQQIRDKAEESNTVQEVYSETLAEVYIQQGLKNKAIEVYQKLSLLDPAKSAYFATRISEIKRN